MFHPRKLTLTNVGICAADVVGNYQSKHRIAQKLISLVVQPAGLVTGARRHLLMRPGSVCDRALEQRSVVKLVRQNCLEAIQIRIVSVVSLQASRIVTNAGSLSK